MTRQLLIYDRVVPIGQASHGDVSVLVSGTYAFAREQNSVPLLAVEFMAAALDHPIIFARNGEDIFPAALMGLRPSENVHIEFDGRWTGGYIPAFLRRYPFVFSRQDEDSDDTFTLCIDEAYSGVNREDRGERLFDAEGNRSPYLEKNLAFVAEFQRQFHATRTVCKRLAELDLLQEVQIRYSDANDRQGHIGGFATIDRERLKRLSSETLKGLLASGQLDLIYAHLQSLTRVPLLGQKLREASDVAVTAV